MKNRILQKLVIGLALAFIPLVGGCLQQTGMSPQSSALIATPSDELQFGDTQQSEGDFGPAENTAESEISDAPARPISTEKPLPPNIRPTESLAGMIRLANSGVDENVMLAYVTNSAGTFSLGPEEIIYLNDVGVPAPVVTAMLQHDHMMVESAINAARPPFVPNTEPTDPDPSGVPTEPAPPPDYVSDYVPEQPAIEPSDATFRDSLAPYGTWVDVGGYGQCWQPSVVSINPGWQPYCDRGHWVYSDCGWYWLSDYSWGWAPFHYGRWFRHSHLGWCWQPDRVWGPSWVSWRYSNDYCGWAPLPPAACFRPGLGFTYRGHSVGFSFNFPIAASCFTFVPARNFCDLHLSRYAVHREHFARFYNSTVAITKIIGDNHKIINRGIPVEHISAAARAHIRQVAVHEVSAPASAGIRAERLEASGRTLTVFRPPVVQQPRTFSSSSQRSTANSDVSARARVAPRENTAPLIIRGTRRGTQSVADSSARYFSRPVGNQPALAQAGTTTATMHSRSAGAWSSMPRSVQGPPRFEQPSAYQHEPAAGGAQSQSEWNSAPSGPAAEPAQRQYEAPAYHAPPQMPHYAAAQSYSPPVQHSSYEMPSHHSSDSHSANRMPAPPAPVVASSPGHSSSDKHGR